MKDFKMNFAGIDYSLTSPGITIISDNKVTSYFLTTKAKLLGELKLSDDFTIVGIEYPDHTSDVERFNKLAKIMISVMPDIQDTKTAIEGYSFGSTGARLFQIGENCGVLKNLLWELGYEFRTFAPTEVKKFASGKGNASKTEMINTFILETGIDIRCALNVKETFDGSPISDIVDSYYLAMMMKNDYMTKQI